MVGHGKLEWHWHYYILDTFWTQSSTLTVLDKATCGLHFQLWCLFLSLQQGRAFIMSHLLEPRFGGWLGVTCPLMFWWEVSAGSSFHWLCIFFILFLADICIPCAAHVLAQSNDLSDVLLQDGPHLGVGLLKRDLVTKMSCQADERWGHNTGHYPNLFLFPRFYANESRIQGTNITTLDTAEVSR